MATGLVNPYAIAPGYDPTTFPFKHLYWAGGPNFQAMGYANGDDVTSWPCEITGLTTDALVVKNGYASNLFTYSAAGLNGKPSVNFSASAHKGMGLPSSFSDWYSLSYSGTYPLQAQCAAFQVAGTDTALKYIAAGSQTADGAADMKYLAVSYSGGPYGYGGNFSSAVANYTGHTAHAVSTQLIDTQHTYSGRNEFFASTNKVEGSYTSTKDNWYYWRMGGVGNTTANSFVGEIGFVGIYRDSGYGGAGTPMMQGVADYPDLNDWFLSEYGMALS